MKQRELILFFLIVIGLCGLAAGLYFFTRPLERVPNLSPVLPEGVFAAMDGPNRITSLKDGRLGWTMENQGLVFYRERGEVDVHSPRASIPVDDGGTVEVSGELGFFEQGSQDISLHGGVDIGMRKSGREEWRFRAENAYYRRQAQAFELDDLAGMLSPASGDTVTISGGLGRYQIGPRVMTLDREVRCRLQGGVNLTTDHLRYEVGPETATTDVEVTVVGKGFTLKSAGLAANLKTRQVVAPANVRLKLDPKKAKP